jgi:hypothetical protein
MAIGDTVSAGLLRTDFSPFNRAGVARGNVGYLTGMAMGRAQPSPPRSLESNLGTPPRSGSPTQNMERNQQIALQDEFLRRLSGTKQTDELTPEAEEKLQKGIKKFSSNDPRRKASVNDIEKFTQRIKNDPKNYKTVNISDLRGNEFLNQFRDDPRLFGMAFDFNSKRIERDLASQPKPMTPEELADYEAKLIANETNRIKLNNLQNPPAPPAPPEPVYIEAALDAIDVAITLVDKDSIFNPTAGFGSETAKSIGGSDAADLEAALSTITSAVGFKRLQDMREASPTGGALGSVSERELSQLNAALGSISQKQSPEQLKKNLLKIKDHYQKAVDAINAQRIAYNSGLTFKTQEEALKYIQSQKSSNAIKTDQGDYSIEGLSVEAQ